MVIVAVCGAPHSGKSVFLHHLYKSLIPQTEDFMIQNVIIDGEGQWFLESKYGIKFRRKFKDYKSYVNFVIDNIENLKKSKKLVIIDLGGLPSEENKKILEYCDYYIFLMREDMMNSDIIKGWKKLLSEVKTKPLGIFISAWEGDPCVIHKDNYFEAKLVKLDREGVPPETEKIINMFANYLIEKFNLEVKTMNENKFKIDIKENNDWIFIDIKITTESGIIKPEDLPELLNSVYSKVDNKYFGKGVIISGRMPVWAYVSLAHLFHGAKFVATFDPRIGAIITVSHCSEYGVGDIIPLEEIIAEK